MKTLILIILFSALSLAQTYDVGQTNANISSALVKALAQSDSNTVYRNELNSKAPKASPTFTGTVVLPSGTSIGNVSSTEIGYVDNVTSAIQTQLNAKGTVVVDDSLAADIAAIGDSNFVLTSETSTWDKIESDDLNLADSTIYLTPSDAAAAYQPLEATLTDIADGTISENLVNTAYPWAENEVASTLATETEAKGFIADSVANNLAEFDTQIGITGTPSATTYWRGDNSWATPAGGGDMTKAVYDVDANNAVDRADSLKKNYGRVGADSIATLAQAKSLAQQTVSDSSLDATTQGAIPMVHNSAWVERAPGAALDTLLKYISNFPTAITIGSAYIYRVGGTDVADGDVADNITITNVSQVQDITASATELNYSTNVTSDIQAQFRSKADTLCYHWGVLDTVTTGDLIGYKVESNITIIKVSSYTDANTTTFNLEERAAATPLVAGTDLCTGDMVAITTSLDSTSFTNADFAKNTWICPTISATGDVARFGITVFYIKQSY